MTVRRLLLLFVVALTGVVSALAAPPPASPAVITIPPQAQPSAHFDPAAATDAYLAEIPAAAKARSDPVTTRQPTCSPGSGLRRASRT